MGVKPATLPLMHCQVAAGGAGPTAAPECANRHAKVTAGVAIPNDLAERSKVVVTGAIPKGRGLEPHSCYRQSLGRHSVNFRDCCANLPQGFALIFISGCASCAFERVCEQRMEPSTSVLPNLPGRLRKPSASRCANLPPRVAQTFPLGCAGASFQNSTRAST